MHNHFSLLLSEGARKFALVSSRDDVVKVRLSAKFVHSLRDFIPSGISQSGEEGKKFFGQGSCCVFSEDDRGERAE